jgi:hypothetical protein
MLTFLAFLALLALLALLTLLTFFILPVLEDVKKLRAELSMGISANYCQQTFEQLWRKIITINSREKLSLKRVKTLDRCEKMGVDCRAEDASLIT